MGILSGIVTVTLSIIIAIIVLVCLKVYLAYRSMDFYRQQGLRAYFHPVLRLGSLIIQPKKPGMRRFDQNIAEALKDDCKRGAVVHTGVGLGRPTIQLLKSEYYKEYIMQEDNFVRKTLLKVCPNYAGFADKHGPESVKQRNLFQQFFHYDKMKMLVPLMTKMINEGLDELIEINKISKD